MKQLTLIFLFVTSLACAQPVTTFILVRHAEKENDGTKDPDLNEAGRMRAQALAKLMQATKVDAIYSTPYKRTRNTVTPLATAKGFDVLEYTKIEEMDAILKRYSGGTIIVCGHSNTVPAIANYLIGKDSYLAFEDSEYGNIIIVSLVEKGTNANVVWLNY
jgi:2,3-bisphosphoglycerate-dependent phosphoglycerate mutase